MEYVDAIAFFTERPEVIWILSLIGGVCVIGIVNYLKCWVKNKETIKWLVFFVSLLIAFILSPLISPIITVLLILWFLILSVATIAFDAVTKGLPHMVKNTMGVEKAKE